MNLEKLEVLRLYAPVVTRKQVASLKMNPILMGRKFLHQKMEGLYNAQFSALLRQKNLVALDFARVVRAELRQQFKSTPSYWVQSLANLVYSAHRFAEAHAEVAVFLRFLRSYRSPEFLFYLYVRQQFIRASRVPFVSHFKSPRDFQRVSLARPRASEILRGVFGESPEALRAALGAFAERFKGKAQVRYYEFLVFCLDVDADHAALDLLDKLCAFYGKKPVLGSPRAKGGSFRSGEILSEAAEGPADPQKFLSLHSGGGPGATVATEERGFRATNDRYSRQSEREALPREAQQLYPSVSDRHFRRRGHLPPAEAQRDFGRQMGEGELQLTGTIKALLREEVTKMLDRFIEAFDVRLPETAAVRASLFEVILSKCKTVLTMIFFRNRRRFFNLLHKNPSKERALVAGWDELAGMYDYFRRSGGAAPAVLRQFVKRVLMFPTLEEELLFLLQYMFKVGSPGA